jgi:hypothetical protein
MDKKQTFRKTDSRKGAHTELFLDPSTGSTVNLPAQNLFAFGWSGKFCHFHIQLLFRRSQSTLDK